MTPSKHGIGVLVNGVISENSLNNSTMFKIAFSSQEKKKVCETKVKESFHLLREVSNLVSLIRNQCDHSSHCLRLSPAL